MADVSVALATLNGARFLRDQLSSYERQTRLPAELVVSDDGSTDKTLDIAEFAQSASFPVRILSRGEHLGFADNFLRTAKACNSNFIAFSDQDDVWLPRKLEEGLRRLEQDGSSLALHTSMLTDTNLVPTPWQSSSTSSNLRRTQRWQTRPNGPPRRLTNGGRACNRG
jgi:glycosyltransferase involved in cell wall biosynthesis